MKLAEQQQRGEKYLLGAASEIELASMSENDITTDLSKNKDYFLQFHFISDILIGSIYEILLMLKSTLTAQSMRSS